VKLNHKTILALSVCIGVGLLNQNCGSQSSFSAKDLAANHSPSMLDVDLPESNARVGDRIYMASVFADVFLPNGEELTQEQATEKAGNESRQIHEYISSNFDDSEDKPLFELINDFVLSKVLEFHGVCSIVDNDEACSDRNDEMRRNAAQVKSIAPASVTRDGYRVSLCNKLLDEERAVLNMVSNITQAPVERLKESNIMDIYHAFYPAQEIDQDSYNALLGVLNSVSQEESLDQWRAIAVPICQSSGWQIP